MDAAPQSRADLLRAALGLLAVAALAAVPSARGEDAGAPGVRFHSFSYAGRDSALEAPLGPGEYRNPVLAGFYPDPDVCRVGGDYYLVNSSFAYFPGIPVFHSRDLVNWTQIGNAIDRPSQLNYDGIGVSRGIFAPGLSHHGDLFYLVCTFVDAGGNFLVTSRDPAGPWSDPTWLGYDGIDPSLFFDDDGRAWLVSNGAPPGDRPLYDGHRAIWIQEFDPVGRKLLGARKVIVDGGVDIERHPAWIEGPHLFRKDGWYYLICAEGGTSENHSEVVFRGKSVTGPYSPGPANPILTQRTLPDSRKDPVISTGHAEFVQAPDGGWWSVFLGCRPYEAGLYNTGRETFMLPVTWVDGWPSVLAAGEPVPYRVRGPGGVGLYPHPAVPLSGNFKSTDTFEGPALSPAWVMLRRPQGQWWSVGGPGHLTLLPGHEMLSGRGNPSFLGRRVQHARFEASTRLDVPSASGVSAGLAVFQNEDHHFFVGARAGQGTETEIFVEARDGRGYSSTLASVPSTSTPMELRVTGDGGVLTFGYSATPGKWSRLGKEFDATGLSTKVAGGFVGSMVGPFARIDPR